MIIINNLIKILTKIKIQISKFYSSNNNSKMNLLIIRF